MILTGGFEYDDWDWMHPSLQLSNGLRSTSGEERSPYTTPNEGHEFANPGNYFTLRRTIFLKNLTSSAQYKKYGEVYEVIASALVLASEPEERAEGNIWYYPIFVPRSESPSG